MRKMLFCCTNNSGSEPDNRKESYKTQKYTRGKVLGKGASCQVVECVDKKTKKHYALKIMSRHKKVNRRLFLRENEIMKLLDHGNIIKFKESFVDTNNFYIVSELCKGGELFDRIVDTDSKPITARRASELVRTMLLAIQYCHSKQVVHRDLKPENFVFKTPHTMSEMVLIDFGCARIVDDDTEYKDLDGTPYYLPPESAAGDRYIRTGRVLKSSDVWSVGIIAYVLMTGAPPFDGKSNTEIFKKIVKQPLRFPKEVRLSKTLRDFIRQMLKKSPKHRIKIEAALRHPWILGQDTSDQQLSSEVIKILRQFNKQSKLKKAITKTLVKHMEPQAKIREHFERLDKNGDGSLDVIELKELLMEMGIAKEQAISEAKAIISTSDTDGSGAIEFDEFTAIWQRKLLTENEAYIRAVFTVLDEDCGGTIDAVELANVLDMHKEGDREVVQEIINEVDTDGDGVISYEEFRNAMVENSQFNNKSAHVGHELRIEELKRASVALLDLDIDSGVCCSSPESRIRGLASPTH